MILALQSYSFSQNKLYSIEGKLEKFDKNKTTIVVMYSPISCHGCYQEINNIFIDMGLYEKENIEIALVSNVSKEESKDMQTKRFLYDKMKQYFSDCTKFYFNTDRHKNIPMFYGLSLKDKDYPLIFIVGKNSLVKYYSFNKDFNEDFRDFMKNNQQ